MTKIEDVQSLICFLLERTSVPVPVPVDQIGEYAQAGRPPAGSALALALAEVDDDDDGDGAGRDQHVCMVCKEGYRQQPVRICRLALHPCWPDNDREFPRSSL